MFACLHCYRFVSFLLLFLLSISSSSTRQSSSHQSTDHPLAMQALVCLLLALASVEAAVADARYPPTLGKAFTVPRIRQSTGRLRDGFATQEKTFLKYSWTDVPVKGAVFSAIPGGKSGSVNVTAEDYLAAYIAPVEIGGQRLNLDFDTGSSDLWVFSSRLGPGATAGHNVFDPNKSKTFRNATDLTWHITYGDGSGAAGVVGTDTVNIGGATVTKQAVELATVMSSSFIRDTDSDGLLGLAFKKLNRGKLLSRLVHVARTLLTMNSPTHSAEHIFWQHPIQSKTSFIHG